MDRESFSLALEGISTTPKIPPPLDPPISIVGLKGTRQCIGLQN
jgi:hypothetical protein